MTIYAVSDIHGHYKELIEFLNEAGFDETNSNHLLISCGDMFDRGSESLQVYQYLKRLSDKKRAIVLKGNHDIMFINYLNGTSISPFNYIHNGTNTTLADFLHRTIPFESWCCIERHIEQPTNYDFAMWLYEATYQINKEYPELLEWLQSLPYYYETKNYIFTHAAIDTKAVDWHNPNEYWDELVWDNGSFFGEEIHNTDKTIVIGHFATSHLREMYKINDDQDKFSILKRSDNKVIALDTTTILSKKVNVLKIEDECEV